MMRIVSITLIILCLISLNAISQDKVFFRDGKQMNVKIVALSEHTITFRDTIPESPLKTISKQNILLVEYKSGAIYIFGDNSKIEAAQTEIIETRGQRKERKTKEWKLKERELPNGILGFYIPELALGRFTISYERLFADKTMGIKIPLSLTYDSFGLLAAANSGTNTPPPTPRTKGVALITGIDINYYHDLKPALKYYFGPRVRYGTDQLIGGIEGLSVQLQNGILKSSGSKFTSTFGIGVGFFKLSQKYANLPGYEPKQVYPWMSVTWRLGFRL